MSIHFGEYISNPPHQIPVPVQKVLDTVWFSCFAVLCLEYTAGPVGTEDVCKQVVMPNKKFREQEIPVLGEAYGQLKSWASVRRKLYRHVARRWRTCQTDAESVKLSPMSLIQMNRPWNRMWLCFVHVRLNWYMSVPVSHQDFRFLRFSMQDYWPNENHQFRGVINPTDAV